MLERAGRYEKLDSIEALARAEHFLQGHQVGEKNRSRLGNAKHLIRSDVHDPQGADLIVNDQVEGIASLELFLAGQCLTDENPSVSGGCQRVRK